MATTNYTEEIQKYWEVPAVAHFCSLFRSVFKLVDFDIEDFEEALIADTEYAADGGRSSLIVDVLVALLRGCLGRREITLLNYNEHLHDLLQWRWCEAGLGPNPLGTDRNVARFHSLPLYPKIKILHSMCEWRLERPDVEVITRDFSGEYLRVLPMGSDDNGLTYWYFYGTRLYSEEEELKLKISSNLNGSRKRKYESLKLTSVQMKNEPADTESNDALNDSTDKKDDKTGIIPKESPPPWEQPLLKPPERSRWHVVCDTLEDWRNVTQKYKGSRSKNEKELHQILDSNFLPAIVKLFEENEKERLRKLAELAPRRSSDRLEIKKLQKEREEKLLAEREAIERERLAKLEEERQRKQEQEKREQRAKLRELEKEKRNLLRNRAREERTKRLEQRQMRQQLIKEGKDIPPELLTAAGGMMTDAEMNELDLEIELEHMYGQLEKLVDFLKSSPDAEPFLTPVDEEIAPDYYNIIETPMDLETIEENLLDRKFKCKSEFIKAINLMLLNCLKYNGIYSAYVKTAARFERVFIKAWKRFFLPTDLEEFSERARQEELDCISLLGALDRAIKEEVARINASKPVVAKEDINKKRFDSRRRSGGRNLLQKSMLTSRPRVDVGSHLNFSNESDEYSSSSECARTISLESELNQFTNSTGNRSVLPKRPINKQPFLNTYRPIGDRTKLMTTEANHLNIHRAAVSNSESSAGVYDLNESRPSTSSASSSSSPMYLVRLAKTTPNNNVYRTISPAVTYKPVTPALTSTPISRPNNTYSNNSNALDVQETVLFGRSTPSKDSATSNSSKSSPSSQPSGQVYALQAASGTRFCKFVDPSGTPATAEMINQALPILKEYVQQLPKGLSTVTINVAPPQQNTVQQQLQPQPQHQLAQKPEIVIPSNSTQRPVILQPKEVIVGQPKEIVVQSPPVQQQQQQQQRPQLLQRKEPTAVQNQVQRPQLASPQRLTAVSLSKLQPVSVASTISTSGIVKTPYTIVNPAGVSVYAVKSGVVSLANRLPNSSGNNVSGTITTVPGTTASLTSTSTPTTVMYVRGTLVRDGAGFLKRL